MDIAYDDHNLFGDETCILPVDLFKFHLARYVTARRVERVEPMHFSCVELLEQHDLTQRARHVERDRRVESCRAKWNLGFTGRRYSRVIKTLIESVE